MKTGRSDRAPRARSKGVQITRVGVWFMIAGIVVATAATNTGNNGLFLTVAAMVAAFFVAATVASINVAHLRVEAEAEPEVFANAPSFVRVSVRNTSRFLPSWLVVIAVEPDDLEPAAERRRCRPWLVPFLPPKDEIYGQVELQMRRRGPRQLRFVQATSLFPLGLFRKGRRHPQEVEILVYPELFSSAVSGLNESAETGEQADRQLGLGQELHSLREYRPGDDPRGIHWKQSARQRRMIVQQRQSETQRRLRIVFDNAVGELLDEDLQRFERLISEAATAAVEALEAGIDVSLMTREDTLDYGNGSRHRRRILEILARLEALPEQIQPLESNESGGVSLRLGPMKQEVA